MFLRRSLYRLHVGWNERSYTAEVKISNVRSINVLSKILRQPTRSNAQNHSRFNFKAQTSFILFICSNTFLSMFRCYRIIGFFTQILGYLYAAYVQLTSYGAVSHHKFDWSLGNKDDLCSFVGLKNWTRWRHSMICLLSQSPTEINITCGSLTKKN